MAYNPFKLSQNHPLYFMEEFVENGIGLASPEHEAEHQAMYDIWGLKYVNFSPLNGKLKIDLENEPHYSYTNDRAYHLALHVKYYKQAGLFPDIVKKYEENVGNLEELELPTIHLDDPKGK